MWLFAVLCLGLLSSSLPLELSHKDLDRLKTLRTCSGDSTCELGDNSTFGGNRNCFCDQLCRRYGDCCLDSPFYNIAEQRRGIASFTCVNVQYFGDIYMRTTCPPAWGNPRVRAMCETGSEDLNYGGLERWKDPTSGLPVTSHNTSITYRNSYCALCHGDTSRLELWKLRIYFPGHNSRRDPIWEDFLDKLIYNETRKAASWGIKIKDSFHPCVIDPAVPETLYHLFQRCQGDVIGTCSVKWTNKDVRNQCEAYTSLVYHYGKTYRNPHCAMCNNEPLQDLTCHTFSGYDGDAPPPFAVLLDSSGGNTVGKLQPCSKTQLYDPFFHKCRDIISDISEYEELIIPIVAQKEMIEHDLYHNQTNHTSFRLEYTLSDGKEEHQCKKFILNPEDFIVENSSVIVPACDKTFQHGQYTIRDDGKLELCVEALGLCLGLLSSALPLELSHQDLDHLNTLRTCSGDSTCELGDNSTFGGNRNCFCDQLCRRYGDCCLDSPFYNIAEQRRGIASFTCVYLQEFGSIYMRTTCPPAWGNPRVRAMCETGSEDLNYGGLERWKDPTSGLPVTSHNTSITYRNSYCALCHGDTSRLELWKLWIYFPGHNSRRDPIWEDFLDKLIYNETRKAASWGIKIKDSFHPCVIDPAVPETLYHLFQRCQGDVIGTCSVKWTNKDVRNQCEAYTSLVYHYGKTYRNPHCAMCNNEPLQDLTCHTFSGYDGDAPPPFAVLLDSSGGNTVGKLQPCSKTQLYDPFFHKCRDIISDISEYEELIVPIVAQKEMIEHDLYHNQTNHTSFRLEYTLSDGKEEHQCKKFILNPEDFIVENSSVIVPACDKTFQHGQYTIRDDGKLELCVEALGLCLGLLSSALPLELSHQDLDHLNTLRTCSGDSTCELGDNSTFGGNRNCFCDQLCRRYGDCCLDSPFYNIAEQRRGIASFTCVNVQYFGDIYMRTTCPPAWGNPRVRAMCETGSEDLNYGGLERWKDPTSGLPVTSHNTSITYRNSYCALCHGDTSRLELWKLRIYFPGHNSRRDPIWEDFLDKLIYNETRKAASWGIKIKDSFHPCVIDPAVPETLYHLFQRCQGDVIGTCSVKWTNKDVRNQCEAYTSLVYHYGKTYRNPHCAMCNNEPLQDLTCHTFSGYDGDAPPPFAVLLDSSGGNTVGKLQPCSKTQLYDPFFHKCRDIISDISEYEELIIPIVAQKEMIEHDLYHNQTNHTSFRLEYTLSDGKEEHQCKKFILNPEDFIVENSSVIVPACDKTFQHGQYTIRDDGKLELCVEALGLCLGLLSSALPLELSHQDLDRLNTLRTCSGDSTCELGDNSTFGGNRNCFCDQLCRRYGDCCLDSPFYNIAEQRRGIASFTCVNVQYFGDIYMRTTCPPAWGNPRVRAMCETGSDDQNDGRLDRWKDPISRLPATSHNTSITYRNSYCALCHGDTSRLELWKLKIECFTLNIQDNLTREDFLDKLIYNQTRKTASWGIKIKDSFHPCVIDQVVPRTVIHLFRRCQADEIKTCSVKWTNKDVRNQCEAYTSLVYHYNKTYRNPHCAMCNNEPLQNLTCSSTSVAGAGGPGSAPFAVLLDFSGGNTVGKLQPCSKTQLYDPFFHKCRDIISDISEYEELIIPIDAQKEMIEHDLYHNQTNHTSFGLEYTLSDGMEEHQCKKFILNPEDFIVENTSVIVPAYDKTFQHGQYTIRDDGKLELCVEALGIQLADKFGEYMGYITFAGLGVSIIFLILHLTAFLLVPELQNLSGKNLASLCVSLLVAYTAFMAGQLFMTKTTACLTVAVITYYSFLASFTWMLTMSFDVWRTLRLATAKLRVSAGKQWRKFTIYSLWSWLAPAIIVGSTLLIEQAPEGSIPSEYRPYFAIDSCWFGQRRALLLYFAVPLGIIMVMNVIFFASSAHMIYSTTSTTRFTASAGTQRDFRLYIRLALMMGLTWVVGLIAGMLDNEGLWYAFVALNTLQGLFIFLAFTCTDKVIRGLGLRKADSRPQDILQ